MKKNQVIAMKKKKPHLSTRRKILLIGGILGCLIVLVVAAGLIYMQSLISLVDQGEVTGNPLLQESDLIDPDIIDPAAETTTKGEGNTAGATSERETTPLVTEKLMDVRTDADVYNILLIGTDNRGDEVNGRSDSMIILSINKRTQKIHMVSLERELYVKIPGRGFSLLNHSFSYGGTKLLKQTIEDNLRVHIDDFILVNFSGFVDAINVIGGIDINLTQAEADYMNTTCMTSFSAGITRLSGDNSLSFARIRHLDSDYKRTGRQRQVIESLIRRVGDLNVGELDSMIRQLLPLVKTNLSGGQMINLGLDLMKRKNYPISQLLLPIAGSYKTVNIQKMETVQFNFNDNIAALQKFLFDD